VTRAIRFTIAVLIMIAVVLIAALHGCALPTRAERVAFRQQRGPVVYSSGCTIMCCFDEGDAGYERWTCHAGWVCCALVPD
jgi:hypothetical protein